MNRPDARIIALWLAGVAAAAAIVLHTAFITDLSAFLPANPTALQKLLVDQLREGPASRLILIALENGDSKSRAQVSSMLALRLRSDKAFVSVDNGAALAADRDREFLFGHRYLLSSAVTAQRFSAAGLQAAIEETLRNLASPAGLLLKSLVPHDPTGEMLQIIDHLTPPSGPRMQEGVWVSADGARTLLVAQTAAAGSDTDAQERDLGAIRAAFDLSVNSAGAGPRLRGGDVIELKMSGPGVFAVAARAKIKSAAMRLSIASSLLVIVVLLAVYRSVLALGLGLLPVATGALTGIAAVALGFGAVHGITLGFGITLIGESVDYSIYFFIQSSRRMGVGAAGDAWQRQLWPTVRLGLLTSVCGFASLLPSGFPGLAQLGLYSISGLIAAALVTRFVLPELLPRTYRIRDVAPWGLRLQYRLDALRDHGRLAIPVAACAIALAALFVLIRHHETLWNRELSALSPVSPADLAYDARLRTDLGTANVLDVVVVGGDSLDAVLRGAERAGGALRSLADAGVIGDFDSPANFLPSRSTQQARLTALPEASALRDNLRIVAGRLDLDAAQLAPFLADVETARHAEPLAAADLAGTSLASGFGALVLQQSNRWSALLPLHAADGAAPEIDVARVAAALTAADLDDTQILDLKQQTDALYDGYLHEAIRLSLVGVGLIVLLLLAALRSPVRVARVLAPLLLSVLTVVAALVVGGEKLTLLHLVGLLLIVAVGSNYALFFDAEAAARGADTPLTLASLALANVSTVIGFGLLSFSQVPVLVALGTTVAPGAFLALLYSALMTAPLARRVRMADA